MRRKILVIEPRIEGYGDDVECADIDVREVEIGTLINLLVQQGEDYTIVNAIIDILASKDPQKRFQKALADRNLVLLDNLRQREATKALANEYMLLDNQHTFASSRFAPLTVFTSYDIQRMAEGHASLYQKVKVESVLAADELKVFNKYRKAHKATIKKQREIKAKQLARRKEREIEKAKKILAEAEKA